MVAMRTRSGWCHQVLNTSTESDTSHLCSHSIGQNQSCDEPPPPQVQQEDVGERTGIVDCGMAGQGT